MRFWKSFLLGSVAFVGLTSVPSWGAPKAPPYQTIASRPAPAQTGALEVTNAASPLVYVSVAFAPNAADYGNPLVNICTVVGYGSVCEDELSNATTGRIVLGTLGATCGSVVCLIQRFYGKGGTSIDYYQSTAANAATFTLNCGKNGSPCAAFNGANGIYYYMVASSTSTPQISFGAGVTAEPACAVEAALAYNASADNGIVYASDNSTAAPSALLGSGNPTKLVASSDYNFGTSIISQSLTLSTSNWYAWFVTYGSSGSILVKGTTTSGSTDTNTLASISLDLGGGNPATIKSTITGNIEEFGCWAASTGPTGAEMTNNMISRFGGN